LVDHIKNYKELAAPFQEIDDGLGGKFWPKLLRKDPDATTQADGWLIPKNKTTPASSTKVPGTKVLGLDLPSSSTAASLVSSSPTSTLDAVVWASPTNEVVTAPLEDAAERC
jgi:hypothetical protein